MRKGSTTKAIQGAQVRKAGREMIWVVSRVEDDWVAVRPLWDADEKEPAQIVPIEELRRDWRRARPCDYDRGPGCEGCQLRGICREAILWD